MAFDAGTVIGKLKLDKGKWDSSVKQAGRGLTDLKRKSATFGQALKSHWIAITAVVMGAVMALKKVGNFYKDILKVSSTVEQFKVRLNSLLGSAKEGNKVFKEMAEFAGRVPKTYEEIMAAATDLSAVVRGGSEEIKQLMPIIVDISAGTGMAVREVTSNMIKMYSSGAGAADMLRDRGVSAALGFQSGMTYTAKETMDQLTGIWESGVGKYVGSAKKLADTWEGSMSMMADAWFNFKRAIGEKFFEEIKSDIKTILELIRISKEETGKYAETVEKLKDTLLEGYETGIEFAISMITMMGQVIDVWNEFRRVTNLAYIGLLKIERAIETISFIERFKEFLDFGNASKSIDEITEKIDDLAQKSVELAERASTDWSVKIKNGIEIVKQALGELKSEQKEVVESTKAMAKNIENEQKSISEATLKIKEDFSDRLFQLTHSEYEYNFKKLEELKQKYREAGIAIVDIHKWWHAEVLKLIESNEEQTDNWFETIKDNFNAMEEAGRNTFNALAQGFTDLFYNIFTGELNNMSDFFRQFCNAVLRGLASVLARMVAIKIWGTMMGLFGGGTTKLPAIGAILATPTVQTGTPHVPYTGLYKLHEGERVTPKYDAGKEEAQPLTIYNLITPEAVAQAMSGREGKNVIINVIDTDSLRGGAIRRTVQRG